jgi:HNH endonuclease
MSSKLKIFVFERAKGFCEYCKSPANISSQPFVIEHIIPKSKGGLNDVENLALSCQGCNNHKFTKLSAIDFLSNQEVSIFNPRLEIWENHFSWSDDVLEIIGLTAIGRASVEAMKLNRNELKNLRELLFFVGKHPPQ